MKGKEYFIDQGTVVQKLIDHIEERIQDGDSGSQDTTLTHDTTTSRRFDILNDSNLDSTTDASMNVTLDSSFDDEVDLKQVDRSVKEAISMADKTVQQLDAFSAQLGSLLRNSQAEPLDLRFAKPSNSPHNKTTFF